MLRRVWGTAPFVECQHAQCLYPHGDSETSGYPQNRNIFLGLKGEQKNQRKLINRRKQKLILHVWTYSQICGGSKHRLSGWHQSCFAPSSPNPALIGTPILWQVQDLRKTTKNSKNSKRWQHISRRQNYTSMTAIPVLQKCISRQVAANNCLFWPDCHIDAHPTSFKIDQNIHAIQNVEHPRLKVVWATQKKAAMLEPTHTQQSLQHSARIHENSLKIKHVRIKNMCKHIPYVFFQWLGCAHCFLFSNIFDFFGDG